MLETNEQKPKRGIVKDAFSNELARLGFGTPNLLEGTHYTLQRLTRDYTTLNALYRESWIVRRIVDVIPADMLKNWITITSSLEPDLLKKIKVELRKMQLLEKIKQGLQWGRLYGGAVGVLLIKGQGSEEKLMEPLELSSMVPGDFKGMMILDRWNGVSPSGELEGSIDDAEFGLPLYYLVTDPVSGSMIKIHHTRVVRFTGNRLPYWEAQAEMWWGASVIESVFDELKKRDNVSWNIAQLTFMANIRVLKMQDMGQLLAATDPVSQQELYRTLESQNILLNNMGMQVMDAKDGLETHQYTFGGLAECYQQFIMDIAGAAEIPVTKLFGRSPSGLNATGESDLQNYYDMIGEKQETLLRPVLNKILPVLLMSVFGAVPDDLDFEFDPVSEPSDSERSELAKAGTENVVSAVNAGLVSKRTALKELKQQSERTGVWTNITDEDIERASDEIEDTSELMPDMEGMGDYDTTDENFLVKDYSFDPKDHPREGNGRFRKGTSTENESQDKFFRENKKEIEKAMENKEVKKAVAWDRAPKFYPQTASKSHDKSHYERHAKPMGLTFNGWVEKAAGLLNAKPCDNFIDWQVEGIYYRFLKKEKELVIGTLDGEIKTYYVVTEGKAAVINYYAIGEKLKK